jgi:hypothetical protein
LTVDPELAAGFVAERRGLPEELVAMRVRAAVAVRAAGLSGSGMRR